MSENEIEKSLNLAAELLDVRDLGPCGTLFAGEGSPSAVSVANRDQAEAGVSL